MIEKNILEILTDEKKLRKELIFASLFIMTYENFVSAWKDTILGFFANSHRFEEGEVVSSFSKVSFDPNGDMTFIPDKAKEQEYRKRVYQRIKKSDGNYDADLSLFDFMKEFGLIDDKNYIELVEIRKLRNRYSHEMANILFETPPANARNLFNELINIRKKANDFWIREVEIPTSPAEDIPLDENGQFQEPEWVASMQDIVFDVIIANAMKENEEVNS